MEQDAILDSVRLSLMAIIAPRFYETERGFQGELLVQLGKRLALPDQVIVEQEHQKRALAHGLTCRPDIIIHRPFDEARHRDRSDGNFAIIELKLKSSANEAAEDYKSIADMIRVLNYPLGIFINIGSDQTFIDLVPDTVKEQVVGLAVTLRDGAVNIVQKARDN